MINIETSIGKSNVWREGIGKNSKVKLLLSLLYGGPGVSHELFENFHSQEQIEFYYYN